jgi:drug/metabolite transporter (DMT)-like permease
VLALLSAAMYGAADFVGGLTSRRVAAIVVVLVSQFSGLVLLSLALPFLPAATPVQADWLWGVAAGLTGSAGIAFLYRALAVGTMAVVAPITAVCAVTIPVFIAVALGERPGAQRTTGIALAIVSIVMVTWQPDQRSREASPGDTRKPSTAGVALAFASGVLIGLFFLSLARTTPQAGLWPLFMARVVSVLFFGLLAIVMKQSLRMPRGVIGAVVGGGVLDMLANLVYLIATKLGPLTEVVTLASLYPASTVLLARVILHERLSSIQVAGIACSLLAVVLLVR